MNLPVSPQSEIVNLIGNANKRDFMLLLGAGTSISSGVPGAASMIREWRRALYEQNVPSGSGKLAGLADDAANAIVEEWYRGEKEFECIEEDDEYSFLFERYRRTPRLRQRYLESKIEGSFPSWGYLYLANVMKQGYFNIVLTTNFDDLISDAMAIYLNQSPVVCAADSEVATITITSDRPKIIKLHGDYLFELLKNTRTELEQLDPNMEGKFREFARDCGLIVIGYGGRDRSVMRVLEELLKDEKMFPLGVYWGIRPESDGSYKPSKRVRELAVTFDSRFQLFTCSDFDLFMVQLHSAKGLTLPDTIIRPFEFLRASFARLVDKASASQLQDGTIKEHISQLHRELDRPWAKTSDTATFDLLQAQIALGRRDYRKAIELAAQYVAQKADDSRGLTVWGDALAMQGDFEHSQAAFDAAVAKWESAIQLDPECLPARYSLARYYIQRQKTKSAITVCEELLKRAADDRWLRRQIVTLYAADGRLADAQREVELLLSQEGGSADLYAMKAFVLAQRGNMPQALEVLKQAVALDTANAFLRATLAAQLLTMGQFDQATREYESAVQLEPNNLSYRLQITNLYWTKQQPQAALPHLRAAVAIEPGSAEVRGWLGQIYMTLGMLADAQREMEAARLLSPADARLLGNLGLLNAQTNHLDLAETYWRQAVAANQGLPQPHIFLAQLCFLQNRPAEFNTEMQAIAQIAPAIANQLNAQFQALRLQPQNAWAAIQAQWASTVQVPPQQNPQRAWGPASTAHNPTPSFTDMVRAAIGKFNQ